jgi:hypothetical protein
MKKNRGDEPIWVIIIYAWSCHKETPCVAILNKCHFSSVTKSKNRRVDQGPIWVRVGTSGRGEEVGKVCRKVNIVQILCTHVCKWKNDTC